MFWEIYYFLLLIPWIQINLWLKDLYWRFLLYVYWYTCTASKKASASSISQMFFHILQVSDEDFQTIAYRIFA